MDVDDASVDPDPMTQLSQWLEIARTAGEPMPEAMAVATATTDGRPSSRMVLLRGIDRRGEAGTERDQRRAQPWSQSHASLLPLEDFVG